MSIPSRATRRRAARPEERVSPVDPHEGAGECASASKRILGGVVAGSAISSDRIDDLFDASAPSGLAELRALPIVRTAQPVHPLRSYLEQRAVRIAQGAALLGVSTRSLTEILAWRARFPRAKERFIARGLGVDVDDLFPPPGG